MNQEMRDLLKLAEDALTPGKMTRAESKRAMVRVLYCLDTYRGVFGAEFVVRLWNKLDVGFDYYDRKTAWAYFERKLLRR